jgi:hypothetical protein
MSDPRTSLVAAGYDAMIDTWEAWKAQETNRLLLAEAGFERLRDELVTIREPEGDAAVHWVLGRR